MAKIGDSPFGGLEVEKMRTTGTMTEEMVDLIIRVVRSRSSRIITRSAAKAVYEAVVEQAFRQTTEHGYFRLPHGWGGLYLKMLGVNAKPRRLPTGRMIERRPRPMIRYREGAAVRAMLDAQAPAEYRRVSPRKSVVEEVEHVPVD